MKTIHIFTTQVLILCSYLAQGQHFELPIFFADAIGNKDTIILGYDINATKGIDTALGELDILGTPYTKPFEVRASMYDYNKIRWEDPRISESKKMMIESDCVEPPFYDEENSMMVLMKCAHWPIEVSWDSTLFLDSCRAVSIVECAPGGWFDVCGGNNSFLTLEMRKENIVSFIETIYTIPTESDTLFALFFPLSRALDVGVVEPAKHFKVSTFPNPANDVLHIDISDYQNTNNALKAHIQSIDGKTIKEVKLINANNTVEISSLISGVYTIKVSNQDNVFFVSKFVKLK
ncbi:MAG: T9SS type A sorting domain-containing protein [Saprospiraceae bacterium]